ncbi:hypothetical protein [Arhodomonas aquaeolei]|uniref:hypothetical protein n=1 Tax=Arhodomonas aquaeolei TaxID=2369 RepID=UPI00035DAFEE|nr:hypothetical protein [Arhodomonas aquaeolei]
MEALLSLVYGGTAGAILAGLLRGWISERLRQSIRYEYSQELETHKAELNTDIQAIKQENELRHLRTSLFFDHQRNAFAGLLTKIAAVNRQWIDQHLDNDEGLTGPVPHKAFKELEAAYYEHQLFLDAPCLAAMDLVFDCYRDSFPHYNGIGEPANCRDIEAAYNAVQYLQPKLAVLFQNRIGVTSDGRPETDIALLGAIRLLNTYHFAELDMPPKGPLALGWRDEPLDAVIKAQNNAKDLVTRLKSFQKYLRREGGFWPEAALKAERYITMLNATN